MRGFEYLVYSAVSSILLTVLVFIPIAPAFASEEAVLEAVTTVTQPESVTEEPEVVTEEVPAEEEVPVVEDGVAQDAGTVSDVSVPKETEVQTSETVVDDNSSPDIPPGSVIETGGGGEEIDVPLSEGSVSSTTATTTEDGIFDTEELLGTSTEEVLPVEELDEIEEALVTEEKVTTEEEIKILAEEPEKNEDTPNQGELVTVNTLTNDQNKFSFGENECVSVGDGSFYCSEAESAPIVIGTDRVFSAVDEEGDREIYVEKGGEVTPITENLMDDDAPYFDELSETIVWHRLIDGRYQIVSYDLGSGEETVLTADRYNNMEPSRYGDLTVWQGWIGDDWEIMLEEDGEISMLTDNTHHDIAPHINGAYVVWQSFEGDAWRVKVYDTITEEVTTIDDAEGSSIENPRFVLVYDSKQENGDVETKGYDLESKEIVPLGAKPTPTPESLPDPDQTGEDRAMVQTIVQLKPKSEGEDTDDGIPSGDGLDSGTATPVTDLVVPALDSLEEMSSDTTSETEHIEDVVISATETTTTATDHIEDVIVTPFVEPIEEFTT